MRPKRSTITPSKVSYLEIYQTEIAPYLKKLDVMLKADKPPFTLKETSQALSIPEAEVRNIMNRRQIKRIGRREFLEIMKEGSSSICRLYRREMDLGSPYVYTREEVAYIYELPLEVVCQVCDELGIQKLTAITLPDLFGHVYQDRMGIQAASLS